MLKDAHLLMETMNSEQLLNKTNNSNIISWTMPTTVWFNTMACPCQVILINSVCRILATLHKIWTSLPSNKLSWCNSSKWWWILRCSWLTICLSCSRTVPMPLRTPIKSRSFNSKTCCKWWCCSSNNSSNNSNLIRCSSMLNRCKLNHNRSMVISSSSSSSSSSQSSRKTSSKPWTSDHDLVQYD